jgi:hypothetical protein
MENLKKKVEPISQIALREKVGQALFIEGRQASFGALDEPALPRAE